MSKRYHRHQAKVERKASKTPIPQAKEGARLSRTLRTAPNKTRSRKYRTKSKKYRKRKR